MLNPGLVFRHFLGKRLQKHSSRYSPRGGEEREDPKAAVLVSPPATRSELFTPFQPSINFSCNLHAERVHCREIDLLENLDIVHITFLVAGQNL